MSKLIVTGLFLLAIVGPLRAAAANGDHITGGSSQEVIQNMIAASKALKVRKVSLKDAEFMRQLSQLTKKLKRLGFECKENDCLLPMIHADIFILVSGIGSPTDMPKLTVDMPRGLTINLQSDSLSDFMEKTGNAELIEKLVAILKNPELITAIAGQFGLAPAH
jgi:hypothetical protein